MDTRTAVANRIQELSSKNNLAINALANISGMAPSTIKNIVNPNGRSKNPGIVTIKKICDGLEITLAEFFDTPEFNNLEQEIK